MFINGGFFVFLLVSFLLFIIFFRFFFDSFFFVGFQIFIVEKFPPIQERAEVFASEYFDVLATFFNFLRRFLVVFD